MTERSSSETDPSAFNRGNREGSRGSSIVPDDLLVYVVTSFAVGSGLQFVDRAFASDGYLGSS